MNEACNSKFFFGPPPGMGCYVWGDKTAWDVLSGVANLVGCFVRGVKKWHGIFCPAPREYTRRYTFFINFLFLLKSRSDS